METKKYHKKMGIISNFIKKSYFESKNNINPTTIAYIL